MIIGKYDKKRIEEIKSQKLNEDLTNPMAYAPVGYNHDRYNFGFEYQILPLNTLLQMRGNDNNHLAAMRKKMGTQIFVGDTVLGFSPKDKKKHAGKVCKLTYDLDGVRIRYVWIIDGFTKETLPLVLRNIKVKKKKQSGENKYLAQFRKMILGESYTPELADDCYVLSSGIVSLPSKKELVEDDELYREWVIRKLNLKERQIEYFDRKFYTDYYAKDYC